MLSATDAASKLAVGFISEYANLVRRGACKTTALASETVRWVAVRDVVFCRG